MAYPPYLEPAVNTPNQSSHVLVTGATGFLGSYMVKALLDKGVPVTAIGRNLKRGLTLIAMGARFLPVDLRDKPSVVSACEGVEKVVHAGALSSAWGKYKDFYDINVRGTENIIEGCKTHGVKRLIYVSSPSVMSVHAPQVGLDESHPLPKEFVSDYSETKAIGEQRIDKAAEGGMATVIIRPKAIYGPGDQSVFPRIIEAVSKGRLPVFGDGGTMTNITHVTDVVQAILLAMESEKAIGKTYVITGDEDVKLYEVIGLIAKRLGYDPPSKVLPIKKAMTVGRIMEEIWTALPLKGEPILTRYKVSVMAHSQTYDIAAAKTDLGYKPEVTWQKGVEDFLANSDTKDDGLFSFPPQWEKPDKQPKGSKVDVKVLKGGSTKAPERIFGVGNSLRKISIPALFALVDHPKVGPVLFDTGYSTRFFQATSKMPHKLYSLLTPLQMTPEENPGQVVKAEGYDPKDVKWIIVSHFDPDHIGGLRDFPNARIICSYRTWAPLVGKTGISAMHHRLFPEFLPDDVTAKMVILPDFYGPAIGPYEVSCDLFGDGIIRLVDLTGHQPGQLGMFVDDKEKDSLFFCADACWTMKAIDEDGKGGGLHRMIAKNKEQQDIAYKKLRQVVKTMPETKIIPAHCPIVAEDLAR